MEFPGVWISGQNPGWFLSIHDKDEIELLHTVGMIEVVICGQVKASDYMENMCFVSRLG
jgi:hypothetical protein